MSRSRLPHKKDTNHDEVVGYLKSLFWTVRDTHDLGDGFPDVIASKPGANVLCEIKSTTGELTGPEAEFLSTWPGPWRILRNLEDCIAMTDEYTRRGYLL